MGEPARASRSTILDAFDRGAVPSLDPELHRRVRAQLGGDLVLGDRNDRESRDGLYRALRTDDERERTELAAHVAAHLTDPDVTRRTGAVAVASLLARILGADRIARVLTANEALFRGVAPVGHTIDRPDLALELLVGISAGLDAGSTEAIALLRANADGPAGMFLGFGLAEHDPDWFIENASRVARTRAILGLLRRISGPARRAALVDAMVWDAESASETLDNPAWASLPLDADEVEGLRTRIALAGGVSR